jgi:magnesium transporter
MIIDCAHFATDGRDVEPTSVAEAGRLAGETAGFVWVALSDPAADDLEELSAAFDLRHLAVHDTPEGYQRPKLEHHGANSFLTVKTVRHDETGTQLEIGAVDILVGGTYAIAIGRSSADALEGASERLRTRPEVATHWPMAAAWAVLDAVIDDSERVLDGLGDQLERIQVPVSRERTRASRSTSSCRRRHGSLAPCTRCSRSSTDSSVAMRGGAVGAGASSRWRQ